METYIVEFIKLVAAGLAGGFIAHYFTMQKLKKQHQHVFVESLYEKRYDTYTKLLAITQDTGKNRKQVDLHKNASEELKKWQMETGGFLLLSAKTLDCFNTLKDVLKKNPGENSAYSEEQRKNIWKARNSFRGAMRDDFAFFHNAEESIEVK